MVSVLITMYCVRTASVMISFLMPSLPDSRRLVDRCCWYTLSILPAILYLSNMLTRWGKLNEKTEPKSVMAGESGGISPRMPAGKPETCAIARAREATQRPRGAWP